MGTSQRVASRRNILVAVFRTILTGLSIISECFLKCGPTQPRDPNRTDRVPFHSFLGWTLVKPYANDPMSVASLGQSAARGDLGPPRMHLPTSLNSLQSCLARVRHHPRLGLFGGHISATTVAWSLVRCQQW